MNIAQLDDPANLVNWSATSSSSVTAPSIGSAGTVNGSNGTFSANGFATGSDGYLSVSIAGLTSFQVVMEVTRDGFVQRDNIITNDAATVTGSTGLDRASIAYAFSATISGGGSEIIGLSAEATPADTNNNALVSRVSGATNELIMPVHSGSKPAMTQTVWSYHAPTKTMTTLVDGGFRGSVVQDIGGTIEDFVFAANIGGTNLLGAEVSATIRSIIVNPNPVELPYKPGLSNVDLLGNSFPSFFSDVDADGQSFDNVLEYRGWKTLVEQGYRGPNITKANVGGTTMCDSAIVPGDNMSQYFSGWAARKSGTVVICPFENDLYPANATNAEVFDGSTGSEANIKILIDLLLANGTDAIVITTPADSILQSGVTGADLIEAQSRLVSLTAVALSLTSYSNRIAVYGLGSDLGSASSNENYLGTIESAGNTGNGGGTAPATRTDVHPSGFGTGIISDNLPVTLLAITDKVNNMAYQAKAVQYSAGGNLTSLNVLAGSNPSTSQGTMSIWLNFEGVLANANYMLMNSNSGKWRSELIVSGGVCNLSIWGRNLADSTKIMEAIIGPIPNVAGWQNITLSFDITTDTIHGFVNGVSSVVSSNFPHNSPSADDTVVWARIYSFASNGGSAPLYQACSSDATLGSYLIDLSVAANLEEYYSATGSAVNPLLRSNAEFIILDGDKDDVEVNTNGSAGGSFTKIQTVDNCATAPPIEPSGGPALIAPLTHALTHSLTHSLTG